MSLLEPPAADVYLDPQLDLTPLTDTYLFYPCSGGDLLTPLMMFAQHIRGFCFADYGYFRPKQQNVRRFGLDKLVDEAGPIMAPNGEWIYEDRQAIRDQSGDFGWQFDKLIERYRLLDTGKSFEMMRTGADARDAFFQLSEPLGIFFYRGDSLGEGGSGIHWNSQDMHFEIGRRLVDGGLLITDGCNPGAAVADYAFGHAVTRAREMTPGSPWRSKLHLTSVLVPHGDLKCVGYAGYRYGATLIWQFSKRSSWKRQQI